MSQIIVLDTHIWFWFISQQLEAIIMNTAKLTSDGTHQTVILAPDFKMTGTEVYIKKIGNAIILISKDNPWQTLIDSLNQFSDDFMMTRNQLPIDKR